MSIDVLEKEMFLLDPSEFCHWALVCKVNEGIEGLSDANNVV